MSGFWAPKFLSGQAKQQAHCHCPPPSGAGWSLPLYKWDPRLLCRDFHVHLQNSGTTEFPSCSTSMNFPLSMRACGYLPLCSATLGCTNSRPGFPSPPPPPCPNMWLLGLWAPCSNVGICFMDLYSKILLCDRYCCLTFISHREVGSDRVPSTGLAACYL